MNSVMPPHQRAGEAFWTSDDPHLSGNFAPIQSELDVADLQVISGAIPPDLSGAYMRNGPNPQFKPVSYTYPLDGDGMIHAVYFNNGRARYKNRFVRTRALDVERRAGRAVYGGFRQSGPIDPALLKPGDPDFFKNGAFINVLRHGDHLLALSEASPAYELTAELETLGEWTAGTAEPISLGAHNRRHPRTGVLFALEYSVQDPAVCFHEIDPSGRLTRSLPLTLPSASMIHDFVLTDRFIVLLIGPAIFDMAAAASGQSFLQWRPDLGTRSRCCRSMAANRSGWNSRPFSCSTSQMASSAAARSSSTTCATRA
ncbi:MAG: carotenoid oxygenase family protein [Rhizobiaceae bacterium]|nr:carotenoid oxygenase family protein [Rhizobiaceae bacterium]